MLHCDYQVTRLWIFIASLAWNRDTSRIDQRLLRTSRITAKNRFGGLAGLPVCDEGRHLLGSVRTSTRFLVKVKLSRRASTENMDIETIFHIWTIRETSKGRSLDPRTTTRSKQKNELSVLETSVEYPEEHVYKQLNIATSPSENEISQLGTTSGAIVITTAVTIKRK